MNHKKILDQIIDGGKTKRLTQSYIECRKKILSSLPDHYMYCYNVTESNLLNYMKRFLPKDKKNSACIGAIRTRFRQAAEYLSLQQLYRINNNGKV